MSGVPFGLTVDVDGVADAIREITNYKARLNLKAYQLQEKVAEIIRDEADAVFAMGLLDDTFATREKDVSGKAVLVSDPPKIGGNVSVTIGHDGPGNRFTLVIARGNGGSMDHIWMEFGDGVYYNGAAGTSPHPRASAFGFVIGGYGKGQGRKPVWAYGGTDGKIHLTHGTPASMPLYHAMMDAWADIINIARTVFST